MHKRATWVVAGFIAVVVTAAILDAVFFRSHAPASTRRASSTNLFGALPSCTPDELALRIEHRKDLPGGTTLPLGIGVDEPLPNLPARETGVDLQFVHGHGCNFSTDHFRLQVSTRDGPAHGILRVLGGGRPKEFFDLYGPQSVGIAGRFLPFRFSPTCGGQGPYFASAEVGPYVASHRIRVFRCGTTPPLFHHADATS
jgi:hypothetical protein